MCSTSIRRKVFSVVNLRCIDGAKELLKCYHLPHDAFAPTKISLRDSGVDFKFTGCVKQINPGKREDGAIVN